MVDEPLSAPSDWDDPPDNRAAQKALDFIKACPHTKGKLASEKKTLGDTWLPWEEKLTRHVFGTLDADGYRQYETVYVEMPKKSGKSHYAAAVMLFLLIADEEYGGELYSAAYKKDQAKVVWSIALSMAKRAPWIRKRVDLSKTWKNQILCPRLEASYQPITRKAVGQHGFNPSAVAFDELHTQPDRDLWDTIDDSVGARREPLLFAITNSGHDRQSICYKQREYAMALNQGNFEDPSYLGVVYGADPEEDDLWDPETWKRANPGLGTTVRMDWMKGKAEQAQRQPSKQNAWERWQLGIWTKQKTRWIAPEDWEECERDYDEKDRLGESCYGGLDLGVVHDLSAWVLLFQDPDDPELVRPICRTLCPEARLEDPENPYREVYQAWARDDWLTVTPGKTVDYPEVRRLVVEDAARFGMTDMAMDRYQGIQLSKQLEEEHGLTVAGMGQGYSSMSAPCSTFERRLLGDPPKIEHRGNPVLTWAVQNVALKTRSEGDKKMPTKDNEDAIIDPVVALLMALDRAMRHEDDTNQSVYTERAEQSEDGSVLRSV